MVPGKQTAEAEAGRLTKALEVFGQPVSILGYHPPASADSIRCKAMIGRDCYYVTVFGAPSGDGFDARKSLLIQWQLFVASPPPAGSSPSLYGKSETCLFFSNDPKKMATGRLVSAVATLN